MSSLMLLNPKKRKRKGKSKKRRVTKSRRKVSRRYKRNPLNTGGIVKQVTGAVIPAAGAIGLDVVYGYLPIPDRFKNGALRHVVKGAAAIGLGMLVSQFAKKQLGNDIAQGALTVIMYNAGRDLAGRFMPNLNLGIYDDDDDLGYYSAGYVPQAESMNGLDLDDDGMGGLDLEGYDEGEYSLEAYDDDVDEF